MHITFKKCTLKDLSPLIELARSTFVQAFEKYNDPDDFKSYVVTAFSENTIRSELSNPNSTFYFIFIGKQRAGYCKLNEKDAQNEQFDALSIELERIYIKKDFQSKKIGQQALQKILQLAKNKKVNFLWLGVWEHNPGAIRFYERNGFKKFGSHPYMLGKDKQTDWLMKYHFH